jgi:rhamnose utilization protein RhaD (predicted bifunctional aldolase and dehydrogenase)
MNPSEILSQLVEMSHTLAQPAWECIILGEGNTSARVDDESFFVKASGHHLATAGTEGFVRCRFATALDFLNSADSSDDGVTATLTAAAIEPPGLRPSVETMMHAYLLTLPGISFVGHSHPTAVNALTCSMLGEELACGGRLTAEDVVFCGAAACWVPYTDPGIGLARAVRTSVEAFREAQGELPRTILVQNHGLIVPGRTPQEVLTSSQMAVKSVKVLLGTMAFGGPHFLPCEELDRLTTRPDEAIRLRHSGWKE